MNRRERLMTALQCGEPDRPPVRLLNATPSARKHMHESWRRLLDLALDKTEIIAWAGLGGQPAFSAWAEAHKAVVDEDFDEPGWLKRITTFQTPKGELHKVLRVSPSGHESVLEKHLIETVDDAMKFLSIPDEPMEFDLSDLPALDEEVGEAGVVGIWCAEPGCWVHHALGSETIAFWSVDHRDLLHEIYDKVHRNHVEMLKRALAEAPGRLLCSGCGGEKWIPPLVSPREFEEFLAPSVREIADIVHENDGLLWYHCHGSVHHFIERFVELGVDCLQPIEAPPLGDVTLADAKRLAGGRMCLEGNVQWGDVITSTPEEVHRMTRAALKEGRPGGAFILGLTAGLHGPFLSDDDFDRLAAFVEAGTAG